MGRMGEIQGYEPFGSLLPGRSFSSSSYRFGMQGQENDNEMYGSEGTSYAFKYRMHDPRIGRFLSLDPLAPKYPHNSPYAFSENRVVDGREIEGLEYRFFVLTLGETKPELELVHTQETTPAVMHNVLGFIDWHYADMPLPELYILEHHGLHYIFPSAEEMTAAAKTVVATWAFDESGDGVTTGETPSGLKGVRTLESVDAMIEGIYYLTDNVGGVLTGLAGLKAIDDLSRLPRNAWNRVKSFDDISSNPRALHGRTSDEVGEVLGEGWSLGKYGSDGKGWKYTKGDESVFYHPGGGKHKGEYWGYSSGKLGKNKIVGQDYVPTAADKATIHKAE